LKEAPGRGLLVLAILLLVASLVLHALGASAVSALLILVFLFSLRDFLFPTTLLLDDEGLRASSPLTGGAHWSWWRIERLELQAGGLWLTPRGGRRRRLPAPDGAAAAGLAAWLAWRAAGGAEDAGETGDG